MSRKSSPRPAPDGPLFLVDTREQRPYIFGRSRVATLAEGDYTAEGVENIVRVERKSLPDLLACIGRERERFIRELERLAVYRYACIVVEASLPDIAAGKWPCPSRVYPRAVTASLAAWSVRYGVHVVFAGDRRHGNAWTGKIIGSVWEARQQPPPANRHATRLPAGDLR
jgi:DNA excision repair protein ERCC-4